MGDGNLCTLVVIGARADGKKELIAVEGGYRESSESWAALLRNLKSRGLICPRLFIGDGALGFWKAVRDVYPNARWQRCWVHKTANILDTLPKSVRVQAKTMIHDIYLALTKAKALKAYNDFVTFCKGKYPKAIACLEKDKKHLFTFYDFPSEHWKHIRTTNVIESPFSTVRLRTRKTRGQGTHSTVLLMVYKLLEQTSLRWQRLNGRHLLLKVSKNIRFEDGIELKEAA
jgi:transposase-like protein